MIAYFCDAVMLYICFLGHGIDFATFFSFCEFARPYILPPLSPMNSEIGSHIYRYTSQTMVPSKTRPLASFLSPRLAFVEGLIFRWVSFRDYWAFEIIFANSRGGFFYFFEIKPTGLISEVLRYSHS